MVFVYHAVAIVWWWPACDCREATLSSQSMFAVRFHDKAPALEASGDDAPRFHVFRVERA